MSEKEKVEKVSEGTNAQGNEYTSYSDNSFEYRNKDGSKYYDNGKGDAYY